MKIIAYLWLLSFCTIAFGGDNHVHIEQVNGGDNVDIDITQIGYDNEINFSFDHQNNVFDYNDYHFLLAIGHDPQN